MNDKDICRVRRRLIIGTITEYVLKFTAVCVGIYLTGWFLAWLCSLITVNMILPLFCLIFVLGTGGIWYDHTHSVEAAKLRREDTGGECDLYVMTKLPGEKRTEGKAV